MKDQPSVGQKERDHSDYTVDFSLHKSGQSPSKKQNKWSGKGWRGEKGSVSLASGAAAAAEIQHSQRLFGSAYLQ